MSGETLLEVPIEKEMQTSYIDYAMSVIVGRALPDVRDGLKPVHRRILYAMRELGLSSDRPYRKCARIVGEVLGKYHPHGDMAVYDALVRMAQDFSMRYVLIDGQGNFGSVDGDSPAAMRYTEARLSEIAEEMLEDIDKDTVDFVPNFDASLKEPSVLPSKFPNLLVNGSSGIAVGVATNIPPHNLREVVDGIIAVIDNPEITTKELMEIIKGPDFPTGGIIYGARGIMEAYENGRGTIKVRAKAEIKGEKGRTKIIVSEIPYQVSKAAIVERIAELIREKKVSGASYVRDESDREGIRIVIEVAHGANPKIVLNQLYSHTQMEVTFGIINLALVDGEPKILPLKDLIRHYINHRKEIVRRRTSFELNRARERVHILEGISRALENIDLTVEIVKGAKDPDDARNQLMERLKLSDVQASAILEQRISRLTSLERRKVEEEREDLIKRIRECEKILGSEREILEVIKRELIEIKEKYGDDRRTKIVERAVEVGVEDLIPRENVIVTLTHGGYIKRMPLETFRIQHRGGKGIKGIEMRGEDLIMNLFTALTHDHLLLFTDRGNAHRLKVYEVPAAERYGKGKHIATLLKLRDEKVTATIPVKDFSEDKYLFMVTRKGIVKKVRLSEFDTPYRCIRAIKLDEDDFLVSALLTDGNAEIIIGTRLGMAIRFHERDVRPMGRSARGVIGIRMRDGDEVVNADVVSPGWSILTITENGIGKRTRIEEYRLTRRGGRGVINIRVEKGKVAGMIKVKDDDEIIVMSSNGVAMRTVASQIPLRGRNTVGVKIMSVSEGDKVASVSRVAKGLQAPSP